MSASLELFTLCSGEWAQFGGSQHQAGPAPASEAPKVPAACAHFCPPRSSLTAPLNPDPLRSTLLGADGKYHRLDRFGHKLPTVVVSASAPLACASALACCWPVPSRLLRSSPCSPIRRSLTDALQSSLPRHTP